MMMRVSFLIPDDDIRFYTYGNYLDQFRAYRYIHNFKTKGLIYEDVERELKEYKAKHRKIDSIFSI